jgi:hypothetical protein
MYGGEGGIRTFDHFNYFNILQRHPVQIVSNRTLLPAHYANPQRTGAYRQNGCWEESAMAA